jgi:hypothetical protein
LSLRKIRDKNNVEWYRLRQVLIAKFGLKKYSVMANKNKQTGGGFYRGDRNPQAKRKRCRREIISIIKRYRQGEPAQKLYLEYGVSPGYLRSEMIRKIGDKKYTELKRESRDILEAERKTKPAADTAGIYVVPVWECVKCKKKFYTQRQPDVCGGCGSISFNYL